MDAKTDTPTAAEMIARARAMIPVLRERAPAAERERRLPKETIADMKQAGLFQVLQPKRWGGYELDMWTYFEIQMALAEGCMSTSWVYGVVGIHPWLIALYADKVGKEIWGEDNNTLVCSSLMPVGVATPVEGGFRYNGRWRYSSGCEHTSWAFLGGSVADNPADRRIFLVPRSDFEIVDTWHVAGLKATGSHDIVVKDAFVPDYRTQSFADNFRGVAPGLAVNKAQLYRLPFGQVFFRGISTASIGALQAMLEAFLEYSKGHTNRSLAAKTADDPIVHLTCAEAAVAIDEMRTILHRNFQILESYAARGEMPPVNLRVAYKFHNSIVAERCASLAVRLFKQAGGAAIYADLPFGRILADLNAARLHLSNQFETTGRTYGATLFGIDNNKDMVL
jgi:3-hydroxy-9,10-secoandrosta-1,3,5(10)-triene-9,17-dione monooxygenase